MRSPCARTHSISLSLAGRPRRPGVMQLVVSPAAIVNAIDLELDDSGAPFVAPVLVR